jgi:uncharacterized protein YbbC (DUF1343 family)
MFGAPFLDLNKTASIVELAQPPGIFLRKLAFEPTSNKWADNRCYGFQIHVTDFNQYAPYKTSLILLQAVLRLHPDLFKWKTPPYEYEHTRSPIDLILGDKSIRQRIESLEPIAEIEQSWQAQLEAYKRTSSRYHLYPAGF